MNETRTGSECRSFFVLQIETWYNRQKYFFDRKIVRLMWIYDINFAWTMRKILERGYIEKIIGALPSDQNIERGIERLREHVEKICRAENS